MTSVDFNAAVFEEGFILVEVDGDLVEEQGAANLWEVIQNHDWVLEQEIPVVLVWLDAAEEPQAYGDEDLVNVVTELEFGDIEWGHTLTLEF